jgi:CelD/BcsL family acetyltransferase involved in cellulose biosynthesis
MSFDWCRIWWDFYGGRRSLAIFLVKADGELAGFFPMYIDKFGVWPFGLRIARLIGATDGPAKVLDPPVRPDVASLAVKAVTDSLLSDGMCDILSFGPVRSEYPGIADPVETFGTGEVHIRVRSAGVLTYFDLSDQPEDYLATLGKVEQKKRRYDFRYLTRHGMKETVVTCQDRDLETEFLAFAQMHTSNWESKNRLGHFGAWANALDFHRALTKCLGGLDRLRLFKLEAGNDVISYDYGYVFGRSFFWELPARSLDGKWAKISLGSCALISLIGRVVRERRICLYAGVGRYDYKRRLGAQECPVLTIRVIPQRWPARARAAVFDLVVSLLEFFYFKIWYMRVQPVLPRPFRRPIWKFWSRMST